MSDVHSREVLPRGISARDRRVQPGLLLPNKLHRRRVQPAHWLVRPEPGALSQSDLPQRQRGQVRSRLRCVSDKSLLPRGNCRPGHLPAGLLLPAIVRRSSALPHRNLQQPERTPVPGELHFLYAWMVRMRLFSLLNCVDVCTVIVGFLVRYTSVLIQ